MKNHIISVLLTRNSNDRIHILLGRIRTGHREICEW